MPLGAENGDPPSASGGLTSGDLVRCVAGKVRGRRETARESRARSGPPGPRQGSRSSACKGTEPCSLPPPEGRPRDCSGSLPLVTSKKSPLIRFPGVPVNHGAVREPSRSAITGAAALLPGRLVLHGPGVRSPIASRSHWLTEASTLSTRRPAALRVSIFSPTESSAALPGAK